MKELAEKIDENPHTIAKAMQGLVKNGLLSSSTGPHGGFYLTNKQIKLPILEIVKVVDGANIFESCVLGLKQCSEKHPCPMHDKLVLVRKDLKTIFEKTSMEQMVSLDLDSQVFLR